MARINISNAFLLAAIMLLSNPLSAQSNASKQPQPRAKSCSYGVSVCPT